MALGLFKPQVVADQMKKKPKLTGAFAVAKDPASSALDNAGLPTFKQPIAAPAKVATPATTTPPTFADWQTQNPTGTQQQYLQYIASLGVNAATPQGDTTTTGQPQTSTARGPNGEMLPPTAQTGGPTTPTIPEAGGVTPTPTAVTVPEGTGQATPPQNRMQQDLANVEASLPDKYRNLGIQPTESSIITEWQKAHGNAVPSTGDLELMFRDKYAGQVTESGDIIFTARDGSGTGFRINNEVRQQMQSWSNQARQITKDWETTGQYEAKQNEIMDQLDPTSWLKGVVEDVPGIAGDPRYQQMLADIKNGAKPSDLVGKYKDMFPADYNFYVRKSDLATPDRKIGDMTSVDSAGVTRENASVNTSVENQTELGAEGAQLFLNTIKQQLSGKGAAFDDSQLQGVLSGLQDTFKQQVEGVMSQAANAAIAGGFGGNLGEMMRTRANAALPLQQALQSQMATITSNAIDRWQTLKQSGQEATMAQLRQFVSDEATRALGKSEIVSKEGQVNAELQYRGKALYQDGQQTAVAQKIQQELAKWNINLDDVKSLREGDREAAKNDLQERLTQAGLDVESAKLKSEEIMKSIDAATKEVEIDDDRDKTIAELQLRAQQGDQQAILDVKRMNLEKDLRKQQFTNDEAMWAADAYQKYVLQGRGLDAQTRNIMLQIDAANKKKGGGGLGKLFGTIVGGAIGFAVGGPEGAYYGAGAGGQMGGAV